MQITIKNLKKVSFNTYKNWHWTKQKEFKDMLRLSVHASCNKNFTGGYSLDFRFEFKGRLLDTINVFHYCKIIEDKLFKQDNQNRRICVSVNKGKENKCVLTLKKTE